MAERPAVNASPLIYLSRAGMLNLLKLEGEEDVSVQAIEKAAWLAIVEIPPVPVAVWA